VSDVSLDRDFSIQKVSSVIQIVDRILGGIFPYRDSVSALTKIRDFFDELLTELKGIEPDQDPAIIQQYCREANSNIFFYKGFIGFLLRSSNLRNSFEAYAAIKGLADGLLDDPVKVVLSSEWSYSPFIYPVPSQELSDFILVGLPASESQNALILPLAGHELGHAIWRRSKVDKDFYKIIENKTVEVAASKWQKVEQIFRTGVGASDAATDIAARAVWQIAYTYAKRQVEEIFCDVVGVWLFGTSYLHSFRYLVAPSVGHHRSPYYPQLKARANYISRAAVKFKHHVPMSYQSSFSEREISNLAHVLVEVADIVSESFVDQLIHRVEAYCSVRGIGSPTDEGMREALSEFKSLVPLREYKSLGDVLNAAWNLRLDLIKWEIPGVDDTRKLYILNDLVYKSFEVREYYTLLKEHDARQQRHH
jgi:hypothetical protein